MDQQLTALERRIEADPENESLKKLAAVRMVSAGLEPPWEWARLVYPGVSVLTVRNTALRTFGSFHLIDWVKGDRYKTICQPISLPMARWLIFEEHELSWLGNHWADEAYMPCGCLYHLKYLQGHPRHISSIPTSWQERYGAIELGGPISWGLIKRKHPYWLSEHESANGT